MLARPDRLQRTYAGAGDCPADAGHMPSAALPLSPAPAASAPAPDKIVRLVPCVLNSTSAAQAAENNSLPPVIFPACVEHLTAWGGSGRGGLRRRPAPAAWRPGQHRRCLRARGLEVNRALGALGVAAAETTAAASAAISAAAEPPGRAPRSPPPRPGRPPRSPPPPPPGAGDGPARGLPGRRAGPGRARSG